MKFLMAVSSIDLSEKPTATLSWWCLFRALSEMGHEVTVIPFLRRAIESHWWRPWENPSRIMSSLVYSNGRGLSRSSRIKSFYEDHYRILLAVPRLVVSRSWTSSIERFLKTEGKADVIVFYSVPLNLLSDVPLRIRDKWDVPSLYYEADMPEILPSYGGNHFTYYLGANLSQFLGFLSNSDGVRGVVNAMGARNIATLHWAVDPRIFAPIESRKNTDVFFSGGSNRFRHEWITKMIREPALELSGKAFAVSGRSDEELSGVRKLGFLRFGDWKKQICGSNICLNISRGPHAATGGTSTTRVFELASMGSCIVSNPHKGMQEWLEPGKEIVILNEDDRPAEVYEWLLGSPGIRSELGSRARERVLAEHTYEHRAKELLNYIDNVI